MAEKKYNLVIVAHPDDESIFFAGLIMQRRRRSWKLICVTDGNADGLKKERQSQFQKACDKLKVKDFELWSFPDVYENRLDIHAITQKLDTLSAPDQVYTHGIIGEYGHPHHQDVSFAVHRHYHRKSTVWSVAYNCYPDHSIYLTRAHYRTKTHLLADIYGGETRRFSHLLPASFVEGFTRVNFMEIHAIYDFLLKRSPLDIEKLHAYKWWGKTLKERGPGVPPRLF